MAHRSSLVVACALTLICLDATGAGAASGGQVWFADGQGTTTVSSSEPSNKGVSVVTSTDGNTVFSIGWVKDTGAQQDFFVGAYAATTGAPAWQRTYDGPSSRQDQGVAAAVAPDDSLIYVTGLSEGTGGQDEIETVAYNQSTGKRAWAARFNATTNDFPSAIAATGNRVFVAGVTAAGAVLLCYDAATGTRRWAVTLNAAGFEAVKVAGPNVFVSGYKKTPTGWTDAVVASYASTSGARFWLRTIAGSGAKNDDATSLAVTSDARRVYATGHSDVTNGSVVMTEALDAATGNIVWKKSSTPQSGGFDEGGLIALAPDDSAAFVAIASADNAARYTFLTLAYTPSGTKLWSARERKFGEGGIPTAIGVTPDGNTTVVSGIGRGTDPSYDGYYVVAYSALIGGPASWQAIDPGLSAYRYGSQDMAIAPDGSKVFLTGEYGGTKIRTEAFSTT
jgi:hypothetical protein